MALKDLGGREGLGNALEENPLQGSDRADPKGSGHIAGVARLADCLTPLSPLDFARHEAKHRIPPSQQDEALRRRWHFPWVLEEARALPHPVPYSHRSGQMVWVRLDASVDLAIQQTLQITQVRVRSDKGRESPAVREQR